MNEPEPLPALSVSEIPVPDAVPAPDAVPVPGAVDPGPAVGAPVTARQAAAVATAGTTALRDARGQFVPKRGPGRPITHGRYSAKGKPVAGGMGGPALSDSMGAPREAPGLPAGGPDIGPAGGLETGATFDREAAGVIVEACLDGASEFAAILMRHFALKFTGDKSVADATAKAARITDELRPRLKTGGVMVFEKYAVDVQYGPELALGIPLALWVAGNVAIYRQLEATYAERMKPPGKAP